MMLRVPTVEELIRQAVRDLKASPDVDHPHAGKERIDAEELLNFVLDRKPDAGEDVSGPDVRRFRRLLARRVTGEPVAYIIRRTAFLDMTLEVGPGAFIPRESSEFMVEQALRRLRGRRRPAHVDLATGVGPVALAVATAFPGAEVYGVDVSSRPIAFARRNAARLKARNATFLLGDLFAPLPRRVRGRVDVITVHPPYVPRGELRDLPDEIRRYEPVESLTDRSVRGLSLLGRVVAEAPAWLRSGGWLLVEVSPDRSRVVATVLRRAGFRGVRSTKGGVEVSRVVVGRT
jgi:release factor glutamine methyltransferase